MKYSRGCRTDQSDAGDIDALGVPVDCTTAVLTRLFGAGVSALRLACLKARNDVRALLVWR